MNTQTALITGASQGLGYEFAILCAKNHYNLVLVARNKSKLELIKKDLAEKYGVTIHIIIKDLSKTAAAQEVYEAVKKAKLQIDVLINNAGFGTYGPFVDLDTQTELEQIQLNVLTLTHLTKLLLNDMVERKEGRILCVASTAAFLPGPLMAVYYATKAFVLSFSEALHEELRGSGVTVTALCPGPTSTGFTNRGKLERSPIFRGNLMNAHDVAEAGFQGMLNGRSIVIPGIRNKIQIWLIRFTPRPFVARIVKRAQTPVK